MFFFNSTNIRHEQPEEKPITELLHDYRHVTVNEWMVAHSLSVRSKWSSSTGLTPGSPLSLFSLWTVSSLKARRSLEKTSTAGGHFSSQCEGETAAATPTHRLHTLWVLKGQQTYNLSFRSGFSLESWDTRVSLVRRTVTEKRVSG